MLKIISSIYSLSIAEWPGHFHLLKIETGYSSTPRNRGKPRIHGEKPVSVIKLKTRITRHFNRVSLEFAGPLKRDWWRLKNCGLVFFFTGLVNFNSKAVWTILQLYVQIKLLKPGTAVVNNRYSPCASLSRGNQQVIFWRKKGMMTVYNLYPFLFCACTSCTTSCLY